MDSAGTAKSHAAAEFGPSHAEHVAQDPKQGRVRVDIDCVVGTVDLDRKGHGCLVRCWWLGDCGEERKLHTRNVVSACDLPRKVGATSATPARSPLLHANVQRPWI